MKPLLWMRAIRDLGELPASRLAVLLCLALRMDVNGAGFASNQQLATDAAVSTDTVKRATKWARQRDHLIQVQRGHRLGDGRTMASRWQLSQGCTGDTLRNLKGAEANLKGARVHTPEVSIQEMSPSLPYVSTGSAPAAAQNGGREPHKTEPNARAALARLRAERSLPFTEDELLELAYEIGPDPYYDGFRAIDAATTASFNSARDIRKVLRSRLGVAS